MNRIAREIEFQNWVEGKLNVAGAHVQSHVYSHFNSIPDLSAGFGNENYWLELKYDEFRMPNTPGARYDRFYFTTLTRGQVDWLIRRQKTGGGYCGILGMFTIKPTGRQHVAYVPGEWYLRNLWPHGERFSVGAALLSGLTAPYAELLTGMDLLDFIHEADRWASKNEVPL